MPPKKGVLMITVVIIQRESVINDPAFLMSPSGMVEIPRLEAKLSLRNGRLILSASYFEIGTKPTMSIWTIRHQNCHSGENRNPGNRRKKLDSCWSLSRTWYGTGMTGKRTKMVKVDFKSTACWRTPRLQGEGSSVNFWKDLLFSFINIVS